MQLRRIRFTRGALAAALLLLALAVGRDRSAASARRSGGPVRRDVVRELKNGRVVLAPALRRAIAEQFPGFHQVGDFAPGDFDGDGLEDVALYLTNRRHGLPHLQSIWLFVAFNQTPSGEFKPYVLARRPDPSTIYDRDFHRRRQFDDYGFVVGMGTFTIDPGTGHGREVRFEKDVMIETGAGDWRLWYFRGGRYHWVWDVGNDTDE